MIGSWDDLALEAELKKERGEQDAVQTMQKQKFTPLQMGKGSREQDSREA